MSLGRFCQPSVIQTILDGSILCHVRKARHPIPQPFVRVQRCSFSSLLFSLLQLGLDQPYPTSEVFCVLLYRAGILASRLALRCCCLQPETIGQSINLTPQTMAPQYLTASFARDSLALATLEVSSSMTGVLFEIGRQKIEDEMPLRMPSLKWS